MGGKSQQKPPAYPLSLKDLCVLPFLPELMDAKIDSFKIEGRMLSPGYVAWRYCNLPQIYGFVSDGSESIGKSIRRIRSFWHSLTFRSEAGGRILSQA